MTKQTAVVEWVSVADGMPEIPADAPTYARSVDVLVSYRGAGGITRKVRVLSWCNPDTKKPKPPRWEWDRGIWNCGEVTHWAYMPAPAGAT